MNKITKIVASVLIGIYSAASANQMLDVNSEGFENVISGNSSIVKFKTESGSYLEYEITDQEMDILKSKQNAIKGYLHEESSLYDLRKILDGDQKEKAWLAVKDQTAPLTAKEITALRKLKQTTAKYENRPLNNVKFNIKTKNIDLEASKPIEIIVAKGYVSSIQFYDETGAPWPIEGDIIGNTSAFEKHKLGARQHVAAFQIKEVFSESNALINLVGLDATIVIKLKGSDTEFDSRLTVRIPKLGPNAEIYENAQVQYNELDSQLTRVLNGDILRGAKRYDLIGVDGVAFLKDGFLYIRTPHKLVIPPPINASRTSTGMMAFKTAPTEDFLFTVDGEMKQASIQEVFEVKIKQKNSLFK